MKLSLDGCWEVTWSKLYAEFYEGKNSQILELKKDFGNNPLNKYYWPTCYVPGTGLGSEESKIKNLGELVKLNKEIYKYLNVCYNRRILAPLK